MPQAQPLAGDIEFGLQGAEEVLQNVSVILATVKGSVPLDRGFGTLWQIVDEPRPVALQRAKADIIDAIDEHEPRAVVEEIRFSRGESPTGGQLVPTVTLSIDLDAA